MPHVHATGHRAGGSPLRIRLIPLNVHGDQGVRAVFGRHEMARSIPGRPYPADSVGVLNLSSTIPSPRGDDFAENPTIQVDWTWSGLLDRGAVRPYDTGILGNHEKEQNKKLIRSG